MYQRVGKAAYKADLSNTWKLAEYLGNPQDSLKCVHVGGTNGKGSTSHMIASVLQEAGYKAGLYTSPHLKDFRERIKINGIMIPEHSVTDFINRHKTFFESEQLSFFEMTVGLALDYFRSEEVDIAVIEVGLGGRLDSTNIISSEISVITNIGLDHTQFLGNTLTEIAKEKAGIIKKGIPVIIGEIQSATQPIFLEKAKEVHTSIYFAEDLELELFPCDLKGIYQRKNQRTALAALLKLEEAGWDVPNTSIENGLSRVVENTGLLGRWQVLQENPKVICDTAHNKEGLSLTMEQLQEQTFRNLHIVLGLVNDKDLDRILPLFPKSAHYYFCQPSIGRAMPVSQFEEKAGEYGLKGASYLSVKEAFEYALKESEKDDLIYVGGSTFVVAEVL